jgi:hypothetical protein
MQLKGRQGRQGREGRVFRHSVMQIKHISVFKNCTDISFVDSEECRTTRPLRPSWPLFIGSFSVEGGK